MGMYNELLFVLRTDSYNLESVLQEIGYNGYDDIAFCLSEIITSGEDAYISDSHTFEDVFYFGGKGIRPLPFLGEVWNEWDRRLTKSFDVYYRHEGSDIWAPAPDDSVVLQPDEARELLEAMDEMWTAIHYIDRQFHKNPKAISVYNKILRKIGGKG